MSGNSIRDTFFEECEELLEALVEGLAQLEGGADDEVVNGVFRAVHSIKGGAGAFSLDRVVHFAHTFETVLDKVRDKDLAIDEPLLALFHKSGDQLNDLVAAARDESDLDPDAEKRLIGELEAYLGAEREEEEFVFDAVTLEIGEDDTGASSLRSYSIVFAPHRTLYANGHEPLRLLDALAELGEARFALDDSRLPTFDAFDPEDAYLAWHITLVTDQCKTAINDVFEFVEGLCDLEISSETVPAPQGPQDTPTPETVLPEIAAQPEPTAPVIEPVASAVKKTPPPCSRWMPRAINPGERVRNPPCGSIWTVWIV